ncbi:MAG: hypothetical protein WBA72_01730 [Ornithinimicrobium sp.]
MLMARVGSCLVIALVTAGCGDQVTTGAEEAATTLPCARGDQTLVALDVPGPGRPSPVEAVAPVGGGLVLQAQTSGAETTVVGLDAIGTLTRVYEVTEQLDGWWPDGYRECST